MITSLRLIVGMAVFSALPLASAVAQAEPQAGQSLESWLGQDVAYIIEAREIVAFEALQTDEERNQFIEQFWLRRDPTPGTVRNEFQEEHYSRVAYANEHFTRAVPGWRTDRGQTWIVYGPPVTVTNTSNPADGSAVETWLYNRVEGVGTNVELTFLDENGTGEYRRQD